MINAGQIRAARALLKWNQGDLAEKSGVSVPAIANIELEKQQPSTNTLERLEAAFNKAGLEFTDRDGMRRKDASVQILEGQKGFLAFYDMVYEEAKATGTKEIMVSNVDEREFVKWQGEQLVEHTARMKALDINYKILIRHGDTFFPASSYAEYKWAPEGMHYTVANYLFGSKLAFILFGDTLKIFILSEGELVEDFRKQFISLWEKAERPR